MKKLIIVLVFLGIYSISMPYENNMPNIVTPSILAPGQFEFEIVHRFYDDIPNIPKYGFLVSGADIRLGLRANVWDRLIFYSTFQNLQTEYQLGANYTIIPEDFFIRGLVDLSFFSYAPSLKAERSQNFFLLASVQTVRIGKIISVNANFGYDIYNGAFGAALGLDAKVLPYLFLYIEYGQNLAGPSDNPNIQKSGFLTFGVKLETMSHHFMLVVQNDSQIGMRRMLLGTSSYTNWYVGFNIQRLFDLTPAQ